jgi:multiple sugar transport system substrate-binding protein
MFKRVTILLLVVVASVSMSLIGCSSTQKGADTTQSTGQDNSQTSSSENEAKLETVHLKYWAYSRWTGINGDEPDGEYGDFQRNIAEKFMKNNPNVSIEFEHLPWNGGPEKVNISIASNTQPDVLEDGTVRFFGYAERGVLLPLDDYFTPEELSDYKEGFWDKGKYTDGKHYLFPWADTGVYLLVNKTLFENANALDKLPQNEERSWTYDEFKEALEAVSKDGVYGLGLYAGNEQGDSGTNGLIWGYGSRIFNDSLDTIIYNTEESVKGLEFLVSLLDEGLAMPGAESLTSSDILQMFKQQKIAIYPNGRPQHIGTITGEQNAGKIDKFEMDLVLPPTAPGVEPAFYANPIGLAVFKSNDVQEKWAVELAKFATNTEHSTALKNVMLTPARISCGNLYPGNEIMEWDSKVFKYAVDPGVGAKGYSEVRAVLYPEIQAAFIKAKDAKTALDDFAKNAQAILDKYNK